MNVQVQEYVNKYPDEIIEMYNNLRQLIYDSVSCSLQEKLWAKLPSYYEGESFVRLIPFKDHINIEANAVAKHKEELSGYKISPKGMLQIYLKQDIPYETLKMIFKETLGSLKYIRQATFDDLSRIVEMIVFNYRLNFYPIFQDDEFYFNEMQVENLVDAYRESVESMWVYDDGSIKGVIEIKNHEIKKLFVEPVLQGKTIGATLVKYAINEHDVNYLWALEKNIRAISFYERQGFNVTGDKKLEEGTTENLVRLERED